MEKSDKTPNQRLEEYIKIYLASAYRGDELEVRFGTKSWNPITKIKFDNVIARLKSDGFSTSKLYGGEYNLNIMNEFTDKKSGYTKISNIRTEINGLKSIQKYCNNNTFDFQSPSSNITFTQKFLKTNDGDKLFPIDYNDFQFRINYKEEKGLLPKFDIIKNLLSSWNESRKVFRYMKRFTFTHSEFPLRVDCSIVQTSKTNKKYRMIPEYRIETADVFQNPQHFEIEIEIMKNKITADDNPDILIKKLKKVIKLVLSGLQESNFPISYTEQNDVLSKYMDILYTKDKPKRRIRGRDFVGPSSISLELTNISPINEDSIIPNIRMPYTVTDKADGKRKLMFINNNGKIYLIDINMSIQFTGVLCGNSNLFNTIIDGEHVIHSKIGKYINKYLAFDIYYINGQDVRSYPFISIEGIDFPSHTEFRLIELNRIMKNIEPKAVVGNSLPMYFHTKTFYTSNGTEIFKNCNTILTREDEGLFEYEIDGLILTPADKGIGSDTIQEILDPVKTTWNRSFKWKPSQFNTIDFLVTTKKNTTGQDFIGNIFQDGQDMNMGTQLTQYKTLILRVGFDERKHGYLNPCSDIINDNLPSRKDKDNNDNYKPVPFYPTDPTPSYSAYLCNIILTEIGGVKYMLTEDKLNVIEDETIIEFRYKMDEQKFWQWKPIRVRNDKTAEYRAGKKNYGNAYHVAQSVWRSIHNPVTRTMITEGKNIPDVLVDDDIYYNSKGSTITRSLRDFHNLFVKRLLILSASHRGGTLIDMTVGKGGDFPKWIAAKLSFVFGLDISRDNIENRLDGACARFLNYRKRFYSMPYALFVNANCGLNITSGEASFTEKGKEIIKAIFGKGSRDESKIGKGVNRQFGKGKDGFDVVSNQFSIHYFFENLHILTSFLQNVSECCKVGGYFIGTSYDGRKVFQMLESKKTGEGIHIFKNEKKMWEIKKQYENKTFENNGSCVGYRVDVYQESINKIFPEYLVNYEYLTQLMEDYGFVVPSQEEAITMGLPNAIGNFNELYQTMETTIKGKKLKKSDVGTALDMSSDEKRVSFLNKYFVYKKIRDVNAAEVSKIISGVSTVQETKDTQETIKLQKALAQEKTFRPKIKKVKKKMKIKIKR